MRRLGIVALGFSSVLLGLTGGMNVHRLVDLDQTTTWLHRTGSILQSGFEATRNEIGTRIASFTSKPVAISGATQPAPWQEPSRDEAVVRMVGDLSRRVDQVRVGHEVSARDLGQGLERTRHAADQNHRELVAKLAQFTERVERVERQTASAPAPVATQAVVHQATSSPAPKSPAKPVTKPVQKAASEAKAKIAARQTSPEAKPSMDAKRIANWTVRDVFDDTAVLKGPWGLVAVGPGDTIPGIGQVQAIMRSGRLWIVATTKGVITPHH